MVLLILGCFTICWLPYFVVACTQIYRITENSSTVAYMAAFTLAMCNSAINPGIYAWKNSNFRQAFTNLLKCKSPDALEPSQSMRSNLHRKSSSVQHQESISGAFPNYSTPPFAKKIDPIMSMGITIEEDEDKISSVVAATTEDSPTVKSSNQLPVTIKIESEMSKNSIIISSRSLPTSQVITVHDGPSYLIATSPGNDNVSIKTLDAVMEEVKQHQNGTIKTSGNLIVNKLTENYGYDDNVESEEQIKKFKENLLNINGITAGSRRKSKSANSIVITKYPNKSVSQGSIYDSNLKKHHDNTNNEITSRLSNGNVGGDKASSPSRSFLASFNFGKRYISKSFNSAVDGIEKCSNIDKVHPKLDRHE